jgi:hypothetical protein
MIKKAIVLFVFLLHLFFACPAQPVIAGSYVSRAEKLIGSISKDSLPVFQFPFNDTMRMNCRILLSHKRLPFMN